MPGTKQSAQKTTVLTEKLRFPEGPRWHEGKLWVCDYFLRKVFQVDLQGGVQSVVSLPDIPSALGWTSTGRLLIVSGRKRQLLMLEAGEFIVEADFSGLVTYPCSDMVIDEQGRAYIGNIGFDFGNPQAKPMLAPILLVKPDGRARVAADGLSFPNGMVITPDGRTLIAAESYAARLTAYSIGPDGSLSGARIWAQFEGTGSIREGQITPDGICLDASGAVWVASPNTREVLHVREGAEITEHLSMDTIPIACILGGPDQRTLFITTTESLNPNDREAQGRIETVQVDIPRSGLP